MRVLVVEDYAPIREAVTQGLRESGFGVDATSDGREGLWYASTNDYDAIVLDLMLPQVHGLDLLKQLRSRGNSAWVLILTAKDQLEDRVNGLNVGADDYLTKPFAFAELLARVQAMVRRKYSAVSSVLQIADLQIDTAARSVSRCGIQIELTCRELALLEYLALRTGHIVSRTDIWEHIYDFSQESTSNVVDVYVGYLRRKIEMPGKAKLIHTRRGLGYMLGALP